MVIKNENIENLSTALTYYIKGIVTKKSSKKWIDDIQRILEHAIVKYSVIDIRKNNFINLQEVKYNKKNIIIRFDNSNCRYKNVEYKIEVIVPFKENIKDNYELFGEVKVLVS